MDKHLSVNDIQDIADSIIKQNREKIIEKGSKGMYQITGKVDGIEYTLGFNNGRVGQLYPK